MTILAWILAVLGAVLAWIISLAGAMSTVPRLTLAAALAGVPLPLLAAVVGGMSLARHAGDRAHGRMVLAGLPVLLACLTLLMLAANYWWQPSRPR